MTTEGRSSGIVRLLENNLWAILAAAGAAYGGYVTGTTQTDARLGSLEADVAELRADMKADVAELRADMKALTPRMDRVEVQAQMEREERLKGDSR